MAGLVYVKVMNALYERRPFISTEGFVETVPAHSQPEDLIGTILGASFPFIFRRMPEGQYELIGEAYVHGIMDGAGLKQGRYVDSVYLC